jgi:protocatechuate 3,4-dioxygenase beta subunit
VSQADVPAATDESTVELSGRVIDPDGKPVAGAELLLVGGKMEANSADEEPLAVTQADGTFRGRADRERCKLDASVIVIADGFGFASRPAVFLEAAGTLMADWPARQQKLIRMILGEGTDLKLKRDDVPLRGQIMNPEGQIVRGARVTITEIWESKDGSLDEWEQATKAPQADYYSVRAKASIRLDSRRLDLVSRVEIADDGSFTVHGIGRDRIVRIALTAPGVAGAQVYARTRAGETIKLPNQWAERTRFDTYYANEFRYVAGASQTLEGRVTDRDTGEPVAGVRLVANNPAGSNLHSMQAAGFINATTDNDGRYRLEGLPVGNNGFLVLPTLESGYVRVAARVTTAASTESLVKDIRIPRGVRLTGRVIDSNTGKGLLGHYSYYAFLTHPDLTGENRVRLASVDMQHDRTDKDGRFAMNVLPGRGLIGFMADNAGDYPRGAAADRIIDGDSTNEGGMKLFQTGPHRLLSGNYNVLAEFQGDVNDPPKLELQLHSGMSFAVKVVDSKGAELKDYLFYGYEKTSGWYPPMVNDGKVIGHQKTDTRRLFAWNPQTNEAGTLLIEGDPPENSVIRLQPASTITGRLVDDDGEPVAGAAIHSSTDVNGFFDEKTQATDLGSFPDDEDTRRDRLVTDNDGRFTIRGVLPGLKYSASVTKASDGNSPNRMMYLGDLFKDVMIEGSETKDLGDVKAQHDHPTQGTDTGR